MNNMEDNILQGSLSSAFLLKPNSSSGVKQFQRNYTKKSFKHSLGLHKADTQKNLQLMKNIESTRSELEKRVKEQRRNLTRNGTVLTPSKTERSLWNVTSKTIERLLESERRKKEKLEAQKAVNDKLIEDTLKPKPSITPKSKQITNTKQYIPLYSQERINQMERDKRKKMEELKKKVAEEKVKEKEEVFVERRHSETKVIEHTIFKNIHNDRIDNTEEQELESCTFRPNIDSKSRAIFTKINSKKRPVVQRLISYGKYQKELLKQKIQQTIPSFSPQVKRERKVVTPKLEVKHKPNEIDNLIMTKLFI